MRPPVIGVVLPGGHAYGGGGRTWPVCGGSGSGQSHGLNHGLIESNSFPQSEACFNFALLIFVKPLIRHPFILLCV